MVGIQVASTRQLKKNIYYMCVCRRNERANLHVLFFVCCVRNNNKTHIRVGMKLTYHNNIFFFKSNTITFNPSTAMAKRERRETFRHDAGQKMRHCLVCKASSVLRYTLGRIGYVAR